MPKPLMECLDWKDQGHYLVANVGRWRLTVTRGDDAGYYLATWIQVTPPDIDLPAQVAQGDTAEEAVRLVLEKAKAHTAAEVAKLREFLSSMEEYL